MGDSSSLKWETPIPGQNPDWGDSDSTPMVVHNCTTQYTLHSRAVMIIVPSENITVKTLSIVGER